MLSWKKKTNKKKLLINKHIFISPRGRATLTSFTGVGVLSTYFHKVSPMRSTTVALSAPPVNTHRQINKGRVSQGTAHKASTNKCTSVD